MKRLETAPLCYEAQHSAESYVFKTPSPFNENFLKVSEQHSLWFAEYGNCDGLPVLLVHGGPGGGCGPLDARLFDPGFYRIILFDQRGAGRSVPTALASENTTQDLIADMEKLRLHLGIERWLLCGGSWGSALSLAYGEAHADRVLGFILRGIFLGTKAEYQKLWYGMGDFYPEIFDEYVNFLPENERHDLIGSYYQRLMHDDPKVHMPAARAFVHYDIQCATLIDKSLVAETLRNDAKVLALARLFAHYCQHEFFLDHDQLFHHLDKIKHLPAMLIHGRYDIICRLSSAFRLNEAWPSSKLWIVQDAGHATRDPGIARAIVKASELFKTLV